MASSGNRVMSDAASGYRSQGHCIDFSLEEIEAFTCKFNHAMFLAEGGFGQVHQGYIHSVVREPDAAVKRLNTTSNQGKGEFEMEIKTLSQIHHPNLIKLIGYCKDKDEMVLVYEYMRNGTLADHLYKKKSRTASSPLSWEVRLNICLGAARGLAHLHEEVQPTIIHRDIKATNILLDANFAAKVADFGLSKFCPMSESQSHVSTDVKGTHGYLDPAYYLSRRLTKKSDVYSLGVVFLQVICARPALDNTLLPEQHLLSDWFRSCFDKGDIDELVDPSLKGQISPEGLRMFIKLALECLVRLPEGRPDMIQVVQRLEHIQEIEAQFTPPVGIVRGRAFIRCSRLRADAQLHPPTVMEENEYDETPVHPPLQHLELLEGLEDDQLEEGSPIQPMMVLTDNEYGETPVHPPLQHLELQQEMEEIYVLKRIAGIDKEAHDDWFKSLVDIHGMPGLEEGSPIQPMMVPTGNEYVETPVHLPLRRRTGRSFLAMIRGGRRRWKGG